MMRLKSCMAAPRLEWIENFEKDTELGPVSKKEIAKRKNALCRRT